MSLPRYPKYKASDAEWLGQVPAHWDVKRLRYLCDIQTGSRDTENAIEDGEYPFFVRSQVVERINSFGFDCEAVLTAGDGVGVGRVFHHYVGPFDFHQRVYMLNNFRQVSGRFLFHYLRENFYKVALEGGARSTVDSLRRPLFTNFIVAAPPAEEQGAILAFVEKEMTRIDALIVEQRRLVGLLKEKRQAVISHAVTQGLNADAPMKASGVEWLGEVPAHWRVVALKRIATVHTGIAKGKDNGSRTTVSVPYLRVANVQDGYLDLDVVATIEIPVEDLVRNALRKGDVLMNEGGDFDKLGRGYIWDGQIDPCITQNHVFAVRPRDVGSAWLNAITGSDYAQFFFMTRSKQSTNLASISSTNLMELPVTLPPVVEQGAILKLIDEQTRQFEQLTNDARLAVDLLKERRAALITAAVTGQIDVRQHETAIAP